MTAPLSGPGADAVEAAMHRYRRAAEEAERERDGLRLLTQVTDIYCNFCDTKVCGADNPRSTEASAAHDKVCPKNPMVATVAALRSEVAALREDAGQWRAFVAVRDHEMREVGTGFGMYSKTRCWCHAVGAVEVGPYGTMEAPDWPALLAKLDALRPAPPKEDWRWEWESGSLSRRFDTSAEACSCGAGRPGRPVRRVVDPDGTVHLYPSKEGE